MVIQINGKIQHKDFMKALVGSFASVENASKQIAFVRNHPMDIQSGNFESMKQYSIFQADSMENNSGDLHSLFRFSANSDLSYPYH